MTSVRKTASLSTFSTVPAPKSQASKSKAHWRRVVRRFLK